MGNSWGHTLTKLSAEEIAYMEDHTRRDRERWPDIRWDYAKCQLGKCHNRAAYTLTYHYVTGRQGRVSFAEKLICEKHASKYQPATEGSAA